MSADAPWAHLIDTAGIVQLHGEAIRRFGGDTGLPKEGCLEGSLGAAWSAEMYTAPSETLVGLNFAGCLFFYLIKNHCFVDGNKRIAWAAMVRVLLELGLTLDVDDDEAEHYCLNVITSDDMDAVSVSLWLSERLVAVE